MINYEQELNFEQLSVVINGDGPCLVLAGAGSGKTRTICYRLAYLLEKGADPKNICLLTFTNKASREMINRVEQFVGSHPKGLVAGTFHHVANMLLRRYGKRIGLESNFTILDEDDKKALIKSSIAEVGVDTRSKRFPSPAVLKEIFSYAKNSRKSLDSVIEFKHPNFLELKEQIASVRKIFENKKRAGNTVDFDDLLYLTLNLLETQSDISEGLSRNFKYVLVDEYQDTNPIQAAILYHLSKFHKNILVVGDDAQSIYSFRAADIKNILNFNKTYPEAKIFKLETNYRSTPNILELANEIIFKNSNQFNKRLKSMKEPGENPKLLSAGASEDEARFIADKVLELRDEGVELQDIAVLFRASYHSRALELELTKRDIPYDYRGGVKFFERAHIKDVIAFLRSFFNVKDEAAWMRVLSFAIGIGPATAKNIFLEISSITDRSAVLNLSFMGVGAKARMGMNEILLLWKKFMSIEMKPAFFLDAVINSFYKDYMESQYANYNDRMADLVEFANYAKKFEDMEKFLTEITLYEDIGISREKGGDYDDEKMILSTIHQAKGLEWNTVFVINLVEGGFPNRRALLEDGGLEEERRLFYVAATRAKKNLFLTHSFTGGSGGYATPGGTMMFSEPSQFLREINSDLMEKIDYYEEGDDLPVIDIDCEEVRGRLPNKTYLPEIDIKF